MDFLEGLNASQKDAVTTTEGAVLVVAGPGTGKTRTLTSRYCHLVSELGISPKNILCATFTNKAAQEMKTRIRSALGDLDLGLISTFHSFCRHFLRDEIHYLNLPQNFVIIDSEDQKSILSGIFDEMGLTLKDLSYKAAQDNILEARKMKADSYVQEFLDLSSQSLRERILGGRAGRDTEIFMRYLYEQKKNFALDFNDLINFASWILETVPEARARWQERIQYVMIDEFQDVSLKQYKLGHALAGLHGNIFIVGDSDQTIYTWRGAHHKIFLNFPNNYPSCRTIVLADNYRSSPEILRAAGTLIENNTLRFTKTLTPLRRPGPAPVFYCAQSAKDEADWIVKRIQNLTAQDPDLKNIAVLVRSHFLTRALEHGFTREKVPYRILCGTEFYHRKEIKDAISWLRMISGSDDVAFLRVINEPRRQMGKKSIEKIRDFSLRNSVSLYEALKLLIPADPALRRKCQDFVSLVEGLKASRRSMTLSDLFQAVLNRSGYEGALRLSGDSDRLDNLAELKRSVNEFSADPENTLEDFLQQAALFTGLDREKRADSVSVMTIHTAKGLEFKTVFIPGLSENIFPSRRAMSPDEMEEERRLCYVAVTRARRRLYLSCAGGPGHGGAPQTPSRFLKEMRGCLRGFTKHDLDALNEGAQRKRPERGRVLEPPFREGGRVEHASFGRGTILRVDLDEGAYLIQFDEFKTSRSILFTQDLKGLQP